MEAQNNPIPHRLNMHFPWAIWLAGWIAVLKGVIWLSADPNIPQGQLIVLGYKYAALMVPFVIFGVGVWKIKSWAAWGLVLICAADLLFFIFCPFAMASLALNRISLVSLIFTFFVFIINGPVSSILIFTMLPGFFSYAKKQSQ